MTVNEQSAYVDDTYMEGINAVVAAHKRAQASGRRNMNAMTLATVNAEGQPSARTVLMKAIDTSGLIFFTDTRSRKGSDLAATRLASVCMYWEPIEEQVRIDGYVLPVSSDRVAADFAARPRAGQMLIWGSNQSQPLDSIATLRAAVEQHNNEHPDVTPTPPHWIGYRLIPTYIETWRGSRDRLHERVAYDSTEDTTGSVGWRKQLLQP